MTETQWKLKLREGGSAMQTKKIINTGDAAVEEMLQGFVAAHPHIVRRSSRNPRSLVAVKGPRPGKVGLVMGGGSGHEPCFSGYCGKGLADAVAIGDVFTSPTPDMVYDCAHEANGGAGVLFVYCNYQGDVLNFDMAAELAEADGIAIKTVLSMDDVASAPRAERHKRRGVAGNFFVSKVAGAACDQMKNLDDCVRLTTKARDATFTMGVALGPCSLPGTRRPNFEIASDEMEIGMGIHGELGTERGKLASADEITDRMLDRILADMQPARGARVSVLVNSLGATPLMELYFMNRRVSARLQDAGIAVHSNHVGHYCTSLEMAGASISLIDLDGELQGQLEHPCETPALRVC
jgi:phosphoenolpyruvate---glycerone phosphotransferase subunit DhaK